MFNNLNNPDLFLHKDFKFGGLRSSNSLNSSSPISEGCRPMANSIRLSEPRVLMATGYGEPLTFSNIIAGLFSFIALLAISVISKLGSTSLLILINSFSTSNLFKNEGNTM